MRCGSGTAVGAPLPARKADARNRLFSSFITSNRLRQEGDRLLKTWNCDAAHNGYEAELFFGPMMVRERQPEFVCGGLVPDRADGRVASEKADQCVLLP